MFKAGRPRQVEWAAVQPAVSAAYLDFEIEARLRPDEPQVYRDFAAKLLAQGRHFGPYAVEALMKYVARRPEDPAAYLQLGAASAALGDARNAAIAFDRAAELAPEKADAMAGAVFVFFVLRAYYAARCGL
jgi:tetratricopeptide (TPR) repeat protein